MIRYLSDQPNSIKITFNCINCSNSVNYEGTFPSPDYLAEKARDSLNTSDDCFNCDGCIKEYNIELGASYIESYIEIFELTDEDSQVEIETFYDFDNVDIDQIYIEIMENGSPKEKYDFDVFEIRQLLDLEKNIQDNNLKYLLYRQCYTAVITSMESYLSSFLIKKVFSEDKEIFKEILVIIDGSQRQKYTLSQIYNFKVEDIVKEYLIEKVLYHNFKVVAELYKALNVELKEFKEINSLSKMVSLRHDLVHRGKTNSSGNLITVEKIDVLNVIDNVTELVTFIESNFYLECEEESEGNEFLF